jgi:hypothetical protein
MGINLVDGDEEKLAQIAKRLLATPHRPREESKVGAAKPKKAKSSKKKRPAKKR